MAFGNFLLDRLDAAGSRMSSHAELVPHQLRDRIDRDGELEHVVFPSSAVVSVLQVAGHEGLAEIAMIGRHGMVGVEVFLGGSGFTPGTMAQVQIPGAVWRVERDEFARTVADERETWAIVAEYSRLATAVERRQVLCNLLHSVDQRVCRWLLDTADHAGSDRFVITQTFLSEMLGVRRASVNGVAHGLRDDGAIEYRSGRMELRDRGQLEARACSCYGFLRALYAPFETPPTT